MSYKKAVIELCEQYDLEYSAGYEVSDYGRVLMVDIDAPPGLRFELELHSLVCWGWQDAWERLASYLEFGLEQCDDECCCDPYDSE